MLVAGESLSSNRGGKGCCCMCCNWGWQNPHILDTTSHGSSRWNRRCSCRGHYPSESPGKTEHEFTGTSKYFGHWSQSSFGQSAGGGLERTKIAYFNLFTLL